jgi:hypothetical protein
MPEPREPRSIVEAAEQSAAAGDYASAERLLREAADLQEATLGPLHPDLANTLNNLGVVCEMNNHPADAEECFRRAVAIAITALEPDHPFVATSQQNLRDFCEARGKQVDEQPPVRTAEEPVAPRGEEPVAARREEPVAPRDEEPVVTRRVMRPVAIGALGPVAMLVVIVAAVRPWLNSTGQAQSPSAIVADVPARLSARPQPPVSAAPLKPREDITGKPREAITGTTAVRADATSARRITETSTPVRLKVVKARLCAELDDFACDPPDRPIPPGPLFFYTQVQSAVATTIEHRWYRDNHLDQSIQLRVQASPAVGYRTFSRNDMTSESTGSWRVELRTEGGVLLHEERFSVR